MRPKIPMVGSVKTYGPPKGGGYSDDDIRLGHHLLNTDVTCAHCGKVQPLLATGHTGQCVQCRQPALGPARVADREITVEVVQYFRPNGETQTMLTEIPLRAQGGYARMQERGWNLAAECAGSHVNLWVEDRAAGEDIITRICQNGPAVSQTLADMLEAVERKH